MTFKPGDYVIYAHRESPQYGQVMKVLGLKSALLHGLSMMDCLSQTGQLRLIFPIHLELVTLTPIEKLLWFGDENV